MATFNVKLGSSEGELAVRQAIGRNAEEVAAQFSSEGFFVFSVKRVFEPAAMLGFQKRIPIKRFMLFNKEFRGLVRAGMPIVEGFELLLKRMKEGSLRSMLEEVRDKLHKGESLSEAFKPYADRVPRYYPALLLAGEQSGALDEVLGRFIDQEERMRKTRKRFMQTLTYPTILLLVGMVCMYIILGRAMPQFAGLYRSTGLGLPAVTRVVVGISCWLVAWYPYLIGGAIVLLVAGRLYLRTQRGAVQFEVLLRFVPILGPMWLLHNQNLFARTMRLLTAGGIPVPQALAITADAMPSRTFRMQLLRVHQELVQGGSLGEALEGHTRLTEIAQELVRVGEATGTLTEMFEHLAELGEEQSDDYLELISNLVAPLVLLAVGLVIAFLVISMYLPMFGSYGALA